MRPATALLLLAACGSDGSSPDDTCAPVSGDYWLVHTTVSGDCGDIPSGYWTAGHVPDQCGAVEIELAPDGCGYDLSYGCSEPLGGVSGYAYAFVVSRDGNTLTGDAYAVLTDETTGVELCEGFYRVTATR